MTVQVEEWWNSSDVAASLREENAWGADGIVAVVGKRKICVAAGGSAAPTETVEHDEQTLLLDDCAHAEAETVKYGYKVPSIDLLRRAYFHIWGKSGQHIGWRSLLSTKRNASPPILTLFLSVRSTGGGVRRKTRSKGPNRLMRACIFCRGLFDINPKFRAFATSWEPIEPMFVVPWWTKSLFCAPKMGDPFHFRLNGIRI